MSDWAEVSLAEVCGKPQYGAIAKGMDKPVGPRFVRQTDIVSGRIDWSSVPFCDLDESEFDKYAIKTGDLLISRLGAGVGTAAMVEETGGAVFAGYLVRFQVDEAVAVPEFLGYQLHSVNWWGHVNGFRSGAAQPTLNAQQMGAFRFTLPPMEEQREIAAALGALDDKIESNRRTQHLIVQLADAMYRVACEQGERVVPLGDVAEFHNRRRIPLSSRERQQRVGPYPYYGATGVFGYVDDFLFDEVLVLVGEDGSVVNDDGTPVTQYIWGKAWINNHAHPLTGKGISNELLLLALRASDVRPIVTGAVQPKISMGNLKGLDLILPPPDAITRLVSELDTLFAVYRQRVDETAILTTIRDMLLPELLSGRIRVPESDEVIGEAMA